jgi:outer membrane protein
LRRNILWLVAFVTLGDFSLAAQTSSPAPEAPAPAQPAAPAAPAPAPAQMQTIAGTQSPTQLPTSGALLRLTVQGAEALALKNNPQISVFRLLALVSKQVTREAKSAYYPNLYGSLTAVKPEEGSRIAAGSLNNPIVYERAAGGLTLSQLITDFGRTNNLVATSALRAKAADMNALATSAQIELAVDQAFYNALQTVALLRVAEQTVAARQLVSDQITTLLRSNSVNLAVDLSQTRYNLGLSSIVELSQAQLQQTEAAIQFAAAKYQYRIAESVLRFQIASSSASAP